METFKTLGTLLEFTYYNYLWRINLITQNSILVWSENEPETATVLIVNKNCFAPLKKTHGCDKNWVEIYFLQLLCTIFSIFFCVIYSYIVSLPVWMLGFRPQQTKFMVLESSFSLAALLHLQKQIVEVHYLYTRMVGYSCLWVWIVEAFFCRPVSCHSSTFCSWPSVLKKRQDVSGINLAVRYD